MDQVEISYSQLASACGGAYHRVMGLNLQIRELRKVRGYTIAQLADLVGVSTPHMSGIERGKKNLNNHLISRIASALQVSPQTLIASDEDADLQLLLSEMKALTQADRERVQAFVRALSDTQTS